MIFLLRISPLMTGVALLFIGTFALVLRKAFGGIRPIFRERGKINAEVTGRLTESLAGVRVVKGYHAEAEEAEVFSGGVERLLDNVMQIAHGHFADEPFRHDADGSRGRRPSCTWARARFWPHTLTLGDFMTFTAFLAFLVAPMFQVVAIGTQITEALAGLDRTQEVLRREARGRGSAAHRRDRTDRGATWRSITSTSRTRPASRCCTT